MKEKLTQIIFTLNQVEVRGRDNMTFLYACIGTLDALCKSENCNIDDATTMDNIRAVARSLEHIGTCGQASMAKLLGCMEALDAILPAQPADEPTSETDEP